MDFDEIRESAPKEIIKEPIPSSYEKEQEARNKMKREFEKSRNKKFEKLFKPEIKKEGCEYC